jgi:hypothetical protein
MTEKIYKANIKQLLDTVDSVFMDCVLVQILGLKMCLSGSKMSSNAICLIILWDGNQ